MASKAAAAPAMKPIDRPAIDMSLTKSAFVGNIGRVRDLLEPAKGKAADIAEKDLYATNSFIMDSGFSKGFSYSRAVARVPKLSVGLSFPCVSYGCTALTWAARNGNIDVLRYLLSKDGDAESQSYGGFKPVHHACNTSKEASLKEIIAAGCNVSSLDEGGNTAMHWAAARGVLNVVLQLSEAGARIDEKNTAGATPLHRAANNGHLNIVQALLKEGANPIEADEAGNTPLHVAASSGFDSVVKALVAGGARLTSNRAGKTPMDVATTAAVKSELEKAT